MSILLRIIPLYLVELDEVTREYCHELLKKRYPITIQKYDDPAWSYIESVIPKREQL